MGLWGLYWLHQWRIPHRMCRFYLLLAGADKETAFCCGRLFCFHQCGIPRHTCRFYLLLAGAVEERQGISIPYPSPTPLLTPGGVRCGGAYLLPRAWGNIGIWFQVQVDNPHFDIIVWVLCVRAEVARVSVDFAGHMSFVFHWWWDGLFVPAATFRFCQNLS